MQSPELSTAQLAKQAHDETLDHTGALVDLAHEVPADVRTPQDEAVLREWAKEGQAMRRETDGLYKPVVTSTGEVKTPRDLIHDHEYVQVHGQPARPLSR
jgi:hypothetical protein